MDASSNSRSNSASTEHEIEGDNSARRRVAITSNSPSLSPLNAPLMSSRRANQTDGADEEVEAALMYGAGEPVRRMPTNELELAVSGEQVGNGGHEDQRHERGDEKAVKNLRLSIKTKVLHFTPSWFSVTMGTGVIATLFGLLGQIWGTEQYSPYFASFMRWPALVFLLLDIAIFLVFSASFIARYIMFPQVLPLTIKHPQKSMFLGTVPMGLITITSNVCQLGTYWFHLGMWPTFVAVGMWFFCCFLSTVVAIGVPWSIVTYQHGHRFEGTTAALLLPVVPPITAAATASVIAERLIDGYPTLAFTVMTVGYMQLGIGLPLALMILVLYLQRLILFKAPPREVIVSVFLPLGPCGQGGEAALHLGRVALQLFPRISTPAGQSGVTQLTLGVGEALYGTGLVIALLLFALGIWWAVIGTATYIREQRSGNISFNMGFWSFTFPIASLAICTARIAIELDSLTMKIVYTIFVVINFSLWIRVAIPTARGFFDGDLLVAPCIADLPLDPLAKR
jgi:tellurite resistance protein TehA-like permease